MKGYADSHQLAVRDLAGRPIGTLRLRVPPHRQKGGADAILPPDHRWPLPRLVADGEYRYQWVDLAGPVSTSHPELFVADDETGRSGRLGPGRSTGTVQATVYVAGERVGTVQFEVRSRKLSYEDEYRWMLRDLTRRFTDLVMHRFAAGQHRFQPNPSEGARSTYQRFAFLASVLEGGTFQDAVQRILAEPHVSWRQRIERRPAGAGVRPTSGMVRQVVRAGDRVPWSQGPSSGVPSLPRTFDVETTEASTDNQPNRFVRFALESFRAVATRLRGGLGHHGAAALRGRAQADRLIALLDRFLAHPVMREVGPLRRFPGADQVLQKKAGYRDVLRAYLLSDVAAALTWEGGEAVYGAGKRDVAALYEYWVYLELAAIVGELCGRPVDLSALVEPAGTGLAVRLKSGQHEALTGTFAGGDAPLELVLHFNRRFATGRLGEVSWSRPMQPDCSLEVRGPARYDVSLGSTWLHFDAKYRVDGRRQLLGAPGERADALDATGTKAMRADLLKMHAYRDAILRSAGAYVLYPGDVGEEVLRTYHEILPGLGAFPLRPSADGRSEGSAPLRAFLHDVLGHLSSRSTARERARYWQARALDAVVRTPALLPRPPADTVVGLGYVRRPHHAWCLSQGLYVVRADRDRPGGLGVEAAFLRAEFLVLYTADDVATLHEVAPRVEVLTRDELLRLGYTQPGGRTYFGLRVGPPVGWDRTGLDPAHVVGVVRRHDHRWGAPFVLPWAALESGG